MKNGHIVRIELDPYRAPQPELSEVGRQERMKASEIEAAAAADPDNPPMSEEELARAVSARRLRRLRARLGLSQRAFARRYGIPVANLRQYEIGRVLPPKAVQAYLTVIAAEPERTAVALGKAG